MSFADAEYSGRRRTTTRGEFLDIMDKIIPWGEWMALIESHYPKGGRSLPQTGTGQLLRMYLLQNWFSLSDEYIEAAIYDSYSFLNFMKIDFSTPRIPDVTALLNFRRLLEENAIAEKLSDAISGCLSMNGYTMQPGSIVHATIVDAPGSTKK